MFKRFLPLIKHVAIDATISDHCCTVSIQKKFNSLKHKIDLNTSEINTQFPDMKTFKNHSGL